MPACGTKECEIALEICEWAFESKEAEDVAPVLVMFLRKYVRETPNWSWREVYDQALAIWRRGYEAWQQRQLEAAKELF